MGDATTAVVLGLAAGLAVGDVDPGNASAESGVIWPAEANIRPVGALRLGMRQGQLGNPTLLLGLQPTVVTEVSGQDDYCCDVEDRKLVRVGLELQESLVLQPEAAWSPVTLLSIGTWGGEWRDPAGSVYGERYRNRLLSGPLSLGGGLGLVVTPGAHARWTLDLELQAAALLGGEMAPGTAGRVTLGILRRVPVGNKPPEE